MNILCENIRVFRKELGLTQKELSERLGISDKTVSRWESGVQLPEASLIPAIAGVLNVSIDALYGVETAPVLPGSDVSETDASPPQKDVKKIVLDFKIRMIAGMLFSLLGSLLYRYFSTTVFNRPNIVDIAYYQTAKGTLADLFAFIGIVMSFAGIAAVIIAKVRFAARFKPRMPDPVFAVDARCTGAAAVVCSVILMKIVPEILSFGYFVPRELYGYIFVAALSGVLLCYLRQIGKRGIKGSKAVTVISLCIGALGITMSVAALLLRDFALLPLSTSEIDSYNMLSLTAAILLCVGELMLLALPVLLYTVLLIRLRKV